MMIMMMTGEAPSVHQPLDYLVWNLKSYQILAGMKDLIFHNGIIPVRGLKAW